ncbi:MAG: SDR family NAD(P)-dependent oxidoreductase [Saprospiraceae bacterium]
MTKDDLILVTGGTGFLGSYLLRMLVQRGLRVRALRRPESPTDLLQDVLDRVEWVAGDVTDVLSLEAAFEGVTHVFHCAAMVSFHPRDVHRMMQINVEGTANVVNLALDHQVQKLVHVSSIASLGRTKERPQLDETAKWVTSKANSHYAISKYLGEQEIWRGQAEGLSTAIVNPAIILGSGFWDLGSARFFKQIDGGLKFAPVGRSGFVDVRDVAAFMIRLMESEVSGERYILNAENMEFSHFFRLIADALHAKPPSIPVTPLLAEIAWRVEWLKEKILGAEPMVTKESARSSVSSFYYSPEKSQAFGFQYRPLAQTVQETAAQFLQAKNKGLSPDILPI